MKDEAHGTPIRQFEWEGEEKAKKRSGRRTPKTVVTVDLSWDFDFFIRENVDWDFGHQDSNLFAFTLWPIRYQHADLYAETDIRKHADFEPMETIARLGKAGLNIATYRRIRYVGCADSHKHAAEFFKRDAPPDILVNVDAHHDCWPYDATAETANSTMLHCGNWMSWMHDHWMGRVKFAQVYPRWKDASLDGPPSFDAKVYKWHEFTADALLEGAGFDPKTHRASVRHIFCCMSAAWVPPHHDATYIEWVKFLGMFLTEKPSRFVEIGMHPNRETITPTWADAKKAYTEHKAMIEEMRSGRLHEQMHEQMQEQAATA